MENIKAMRKKNEIKTEMGAITGIMYIFKSILIAYVITFAIILAYATCFTYMEISIEYVKVISIITTACVCFVTGYMGVKKINKYGLLLGLLSGIVYCGVFMLINLCVTGVFTFSITFTVIGCASSAIGGIVSVNRRK